MTTSAILGLNAFHGDSSACLLVDGTVVAAAEEERFRRVKHWAGFPSMAIGYCLEAADLRLSDVTDIALNQDSRASLWQKVAYAATQRPDVRLVFDRLKNRRERVSVQQYLSREFPHAQFDGEVHAVEHHMAHLSSAFHAAPFEKAAVVSVDGFGDFASAAWGVGTDTVIKVDERVYFPHSLGTFYQAITQFLGFTNYGDEYKVMGLAPYGKPAYLGEMQEVLSIGANGVFKLGLKYFRHHNEKVDYEWDGGQPKVGRLFADALSELLGPARLPHESITQRHYDIAHSLQLRYEQALFKLLNCIHQRHGVANLAMAGGCAMNSVANGKVTIETPFSNLYVQPAAGDAGGAVGAAMSVWHAVGGTRSSPMKHAYWGPEFSNEEVGDVLNARSVELEQQGCPFVRIDDFSRLSLDAAGAIATGKVVGWFQGRMEWGPRALGHRSILGDPRRADMKDILNSKIKRRESFRPFAPSILREAVSEWFEIDGDVPFMMQVYPVRQDKQAAIPAVVHVDGSGRLQTVEAETNGRYYQLIADFERLTGIPMVLNTSFNENEPVVCSPQEALDCFLRTKMDVLILGDWFVERLSE